MANQFQEFADLITSIYNKQKRLVISCVVGAGLSAGSGLSTFRGEEGMYKGKNPMELASRQGFQENPELVWTWYRDRIAKMFESEPNAGHKSLVELEKLGLLFKIITQNVDGLHLRAGQSPDILVQIHGTLSRTHCFNKCGREFMLDKIPDPIPVECECGSYQRPSVVWFGEPINTDFYMVLDEVQQYSNLLLVIGTSGVVFPVAQFPHLLSRSMPVVNINPDVSSFSKIADISFGDKAEIVLPKLVEIIARIIE